MPEDFRIEDAATPEELEQIWNLGMYNPLADMGAPRDPSFDQGNWLFEAHSAGYFTIVAIHDLEELLFWTAPPPNYDPNEADWYVRPDLTNFLDAPMRLQDAMERYPVSRQELEAAVLTWAGRLGLNEERLNAFIKELGGPSLADADPGNLATIVAELMLKVHPEPI